MQQIFLLFLGLLIAKVQAYALYLFSNGPLNPNTNAPILIQSSHHASTNFVYLSSLDPLNSYLCIINPNLNNNYNYNSVLMPIKIGFQIRTYFQNSYDSSLNTYLIFSSAQIQLYTHSLANLSYLYPANNVSGQIISDTIFSQNSKDQIYVLLKNQTLGNYALLFYNNSILITKVTTQIATIVNYTEMQFENGRILILFQSGILVYQASSNLSFIQFISFPVGTTSYGYSPVDSYLVYYFGIDCVLANFSTTYGLVHTFSSPENLIDIEISLPYVYLSSATQIYQYDLDTKFVVFHLLTGKNLTGYKSFMNLDKYLIFYKPSPYTHQKFDYYSVTAFIPCNTSCPSCLYSYSYDSSSGKCLKNANITLNFSFSNSQNPNITKNQNQIDFNEDKQNSWAIFGLTLTFMTMKFNPKFLVSLTLFLDDLYFYNFHRNNYTPSAQFFMYKVQILNLLRLNPNFSFFFSSSMSEDEIGAAENQKYSELLSFHQNNPKQVYFINSTQNIYKQYFLLLVFSFISLKIISLLFFLLSKICPVFYVPYKQIDNRTSVLSFISSFIEANLAEIVFNCGVQLILGFRLQHLDNLNIVICICILFSIIIYVIFFYPFLFLYNKNKIKN